MTGEKSNYGNEHLSSYGILTGETRYRTRQDRGWFSEDGDSRGKSRRKGPVRFPGTSELWVPGGLPGCVSCGESTGLSQDRCSGSDSRAPYFLGGHHPWEPRSLHSSSTLLFTLCDICLLGIHGRKRTKEKRRQRRWLVRLEIMEEGMQYSSLVRVV